MADILRKHLDLNSFQEGTNFDGSFIKTIGNTHWDDNHEFRLFSPEDSERVIFKVRTEDGVKKHLWYFQFGQCIKHFVIKVDSIAKLPC